LTPNILPSIYEGEIECKIIWNTKNECTLIILETHYKDPIDETLFLRIKKKSKMDA
jgi:hypothetical protein